MKLSDLDPNWLITTDGRYGMGITFDCPHCLKQKLGVWFANPIDGGSTAESRFDPSTRWHREGDSFKNITLHPSVDASNSGHWHGFIINGEIK